MTLIANVIPKLRTPKIVVRSMSKKRRFTVPFNKQYGKRAQTLLNSERQHLNDIYWPLQRLLSLTKSLLVILKILRLFVNTFFANDKYSVVNRDNLLQPNQTKVSQRYKHFSIFFSAFSKFRLNFERFQGKADTRS